MCFSLIQELRSMFFFVTFAYIWNGCENGKEMSAEKQNSIQNSYFFFTFYFCYTQTGATYVN